MSASVTINSTVLNADPGWTIQLDAMPHSPLQQNGSTGEVDFTTNVTDSSPLYMNNPSSFVYTSNTLTADTGVNVGGTVTPIPSPTSLVSTIAGQVDSVTLAGATAQFTQGTIFTQFATTDIDIPWVSSGSVLAAYDLASQLAGNDRCTLNLPGGNYWSLRGHDNGFDYQNNLIFPEDHSTYRLFPQDSTQYFRNWDLRNAYASQQWAATTNDLGSFRGIGSSPSVVAGTRTSIAFTWPLFGQSVVLQYGVSTSGYVQQTNGYSEPYGFGPWLGTYAKGGCKYFTVTMDRSAKTATIAGFYMTPGVSSQQNITTTVDLSSLSLSNTTTGTVKVVSDTAWIDNATFKWSLWFQDVNGVTVSWNSGNLSTLRDSYARPWSHQGTINGLYQITSPIGFDPSTLLANYEVPNSYSTNLYTNGSNGGLPVFGSLAYEPILPYTGALWDYLSQVFTAKEMNLKIIAGAAYIQKQSDAITPIIGIHPGVSPSISIDNQNVATTVEVDAQIVNLKTQPIIYDARSDGNQAYSFNAGQVSTFAINTGFVGSVVLNPEPVYAYSDFQNNTPYGGYIVTGADNLPVPAAQWVTYGGSVIVKQTTTTTLEVTVNCPEIWDANGDGGATPSNVPSYFFGVSDGQNQYGVFSLAGGAGDVAKPVTRVFQTGAQYALGNSSPGAIANPCASSYGMINTLAYQASTIATGPNISLSMTIPMEEIASAGFGGVGVTPGATFYYKNLSWRIMSATFSSVSVTLTAAPYVTYSTPAWATNWSSMTVDQFKLFWNGKTYDDMKTMILDAPYWKWDTDGQIPKWSVFPGATTYPGLTTFPGGGVSAN